MITAERLKELIKQGGTAWVITDHKVEPILLKENKGNKVCIVSGDTLYHAYFTANNYCPDGWWDRDYYSFDELFETRDRAEWHCKMTAERTERFEPPMWEDIKNYYVFEFFDKNSIGRVNRLSVEKRGNHPRVYIMSLDYIKPATKENYIKACEIVRDLFNKGGAK